MSTLYVLSLRSEEDLVDIEGYVPLGSVGWMWWLGQSKAKGAAAVGLLTSQMHPHVQALNFASKRRAEEKESILVVGCSHYSWFV